MSENEKDPLYERMEGEPNLWYDRFVLYLQIGPSRSLRKAIRKETDGDKERQISVPQSWFDASHTWNWKQRAEAWDEYRRKEVFTEGNAYDLHRIERLDHYSQRLEDQLDKMLNSLPKRVKKPWFNHFLYEKYLQTLEALADETGGRVKKSEIKAKIEATGEVAVYLPQKRDLKGGDANATSSSTDET